MPEINDYLKEGPLTEITPAIDAKVRDIIKIPGENLETAIEIIGWIKIHFKKGEVYEGKYTADQLYSMMKISDNPDWTVAFTVAARRKEIPTRCVFGMTEENIYKFVAEPSLVASGHYFVEIYHRREWVVARLPHRAFISGPDRYMLKGVMYVPIAVGLDYQDIVSQGPISSRIQRLISERLLK
jgi:hypothetical protein